MYQQNILTVILKIMHPPVQNSLTNDQEFRIFER